MSRPDANLLKSLEAGTGIEPVYTDLQAYKLENDYNEIGRKKYQDKTATGGERDTPDFLPDQAKKNPASEATEHGADQDVKRVKFRDEVSPIIAAEAMQIFLKKSHERAARVIGYALTLDSSSGWTAAGAILAARLTRQERGSLAYAALWSMEAADAELVARVALRGAGMPGAPFLGTMDEAESWADLATVQERKAYALACYIRLSERDRAAFLAHVQGVMV